MKIYKDLRELPEELEKWGVKALSKIESPEKANQAAKDLREKIDKLWEQCPSPEQEEKVRYILRQLGKADVVAEEFKEIYKIKSNPKIDKVIGVICLALAGLCSIYPIMTFCIYPQEEFVIGALQGAYQASRGAGAGAVCAIIFLILGAKLLLPKKKNGV